MSANDGDEGYQRGELFVTREEKPGAGAWGEMSRYHGPIAAFLPHHCDAWVIGGPDEVRALIADLTAALEEMAK